MHRFLQGQPVGICVYWRQHKVHVPWCLSGHGNELLQGHLLTCEPVLPTLPLFPILSFLCSLWLSVLTPPLPILCCISIFYPSSFPPLSLKGVTVPPSLTYPPCILTPTTFPLFSPLPLIYTMLFLCTVDIGKKLWSVRLENPIFHCDNK